jgi:8-oxo-dGTP pyrophosphatase MutT (NUDIX family)
MHEDVIARLGALPEPLPAPPATLTPVILDARAKRPAAPLDPSAVRHAAVLALLVPGPDGGSRVILTERADRGGHHSGEVSLPGGRAEPDDDGPIGTALRESREEVGLDEVAAGVRVVGLLEAFWIPVSNFHVTPVLAVAARRPDLVPALAEVARIVEAPIELFLPGAAIEVVERNVRGWPLRYGAYQFDDLRVWGATARILGQLGAVLADN